MKVKSRKSAPVENGDVKGKSTPSNSVDDNEFASTSESELRYLANREDTPPLSEEKNTIHTICRETILNTMTKEWLVGNQIKWSKGKHYI